MALAAIALVSVSAFMHAGWNLASKRRHPPAAFFLVASAAGIVFLAPVYACYWRVLPLIPARVWLLVCFAGVSMAVYYAGLAGAYRLGQMSVVYPVARALPVLMVPAVERALGLGDQLAPAALAGMALVVAGCFLVPVRRLGEVRPRAYANAGCALAVVTALGTTGYSMIDHRALAVLASTPAGGGLAAGLGRIESALVYAPLEAVSATFFLGVYVLLDPKERAELGRIVRTGKRAACATGLAIYVTYFMVLVAMGFVANASHVVAFRQLSVPVGAVLGIVVLREPSPPPKLIGVAVIFAGLVLVALPGGGA